MHVIRGLRQLKAFTEAFGVARRVQFDDGPGDLMEIDWDKVRLSHPHGLYLGRAIVRRAASLYAADSKYYWLTTYDICCACIWNIGRPLVVRPTLSVLKAHA